VTSEVLTVAAAVTPTGIVAPAAVHIDDGTIAAVEPSTIHGRHGTLVPGFVDLQVNGIGTVDVVSATGTDWDALDRALLDQGTTTWCPTIISRPLDEYTEPLARIAAAAERAGRHPHIAGAHLEGPFLAVPGAHPPEVLRPPDLEWLAQLPDIVRIVTLAPELPGGLAAVDVLARSGILAAIGHTAAGHDIVSAAAGRGARLATHVFNAMTGIHHRTPGPVIAALVDDRLVASVIADAIHLHPLVVDLVRRAKGANGCVLVTDQVAEQAGQPPGDAPRTTTGALAGSALRMDHALANAVHICGFDIAAAVHAASTLPARLLGLDDRGALVPGRRADLVLLDDDLRATQTWLAEDWR
jgi:N-acetylglucosamine-6-phosphate deacetylase